MCAVHLAILFIHTPVDHAGFLCIMTPKITITKVEPVQALDGELGTESFGPQSNHDLCI